MLGEGRLNLQYLSHHHYGYYFGAFENGLQRKRDILQGSVLTPTTHCVAQSTRRKCPQRGSIVGKNCSMFDSHSTYRYNYSQETIAEDTERCRGKVPTRNVLRWIELCCHDKLLHVTPGEIRAEKGNRVSFGHNGVGDGASQPH